MKSGVVQSSLFAASDEAGIPDSVAMQLADIFGGDVDFHRDLRKGDRFTVVYELHHLAGRPIRAGRVLAAEFVSRGKAYRAVHYRNSYYAPDGNNLRKAFLRAPLEFSRVSSGFGMRRHPIAQAWRAHQGIDYAAPTGTRVRAVGDAVVDYAGPRGGYGNVVVLRHNGQYSTLYAHLSRIAVTNRRQGGAERHHRLRRADRLGDRSAPALRIPHRRPGTQPDVHGHAGRPAGHCSRAPGVPRACDAAARPPGPPGERQPRPAGIRTGMKKGPFGPFNSA